MTRHHAFEAGSLWQLVCDTTDRAHQAGSLLPIPTDLHVIDRDGLPFLVRVVAPFARKPRSASPTPPSAKHNPFLPYDESLYVTDASKTHVCLLNKFPVVDHHLLMVTREFVHQQSPLDHDDFLACCRCLQEYDGLGFYNSGTLAGASQPHKHLQFIPLPLADQVPYLPIDRLVKGDGVASPQIGRSDGLPFEHLIVGLADNPNEDVSASAAAIYDHYKQMTRQLGLMTDDDTGRIAQAYNLLITRRWLLLVPRSSECFQHISLNALAFAGALLAHNEQQLAQVQATKWLSILKRVTP